MPQSSSIWGLVVVGDFQFLIAYLCNIELFTMSMYRYYFGN